MEACMFDRNSRPDLLRTLLVFFLALSCCCPDAKAEGAKGLFDKQLKNNGKVENIGLSYSIELKRDGKFYNTDSRFPFQSGDEIRFRVKPNIDGYMYIVLRSGSRSEQTMLFPDVNLKDNNQVKRGNTYLIPQNGQLMFDEHPGLETVELVLSPDRIDLHNSKLARSVVVSPKSNANTVMARCFLDLLDTRQATAATQATETIAGLSSNASTSIVSVDLKRPLSIDLILKHGSGKNASLNESLAQKNENNGLVADKWALVVGISKFKDPKWNLMYPEKDARDFAKFLVQECNFKPDHVKLLVNEEASQRAILGQLGSRWLPNNVEKGDLVLLYYAGHGTSADQDAARKNFLVAYDTDPADAFTSGIELQDLSRMIKRRLKTNRLVLILDACHAGSAEPGAKALPITSFNYEDLLQGSGQLVIASSDKHQTSHDSLHYKNGVFTKHFIDGLRLYPKLQDAFAYTRKQVNNESLRDFHKAQTPVLRDEEWKGIELKLTAPPAQPRPNVPAD